MENSSKCFLCDQKCDDKCPHCEEVVSCSDDHLQVHRTDKKCLPWVVKFQEGVGRTLIASRDILPFELIMKDNPLVLVRDMKDLCVNCEDTITGTFSIWRKHLSYIFLSSVNFCKLISY